MNIFVEETLKEVVDLLRTRDYRVDYKPSPEDPESPNGYIVPTSRPWLITAVISSVIRWRKVMPHWDLPTNAQSCIQLTCSNKEKVKLLKTIKQSLLIIKEEKKNEAI